MGRVAEIYRATRKSPDQPWNVYVCRPIAAVVVRALEHTPVTPNQVTLAAFVVALVSAVLLVCWQGAVGLIVAVLVYELSYVLDCADGMLARLRSVQSTAGHLLDFLMDEIKAFLILGAVSIRLYFADGDDRMLLLGIVGLAALASGVALTTFLRRPEIAPPAAATEGGRPVSLLRRAIGLAESVAKLLIHYPSYIWLAALIGRIELFFFPYIAVNALYAVRAFASVALRFGRFSR
jgi:phosphatidylglycerophosphate synthase